MNNQMDISVQTELFKQTLIDTINNSGLPIGMAYYVVKDVFADVDAYYHQYVNKQYEEMQKQQAEAASASAEPSTNESEESKAMGENS